MMPRITTIICANLLLLPIFLGFSNEICQADQIIDARKTVAAYAKSVASRRISSMFQGSTAIIAPQDDILECNMRDGQNEIHLELKKTEQLLANQNLPVWSSGTRKRTHSQLGYTLANKLIPNFVKDKIGDFIFYHDARKSAAVVLFTRIKMLVGTIDTRYLIVGLPLVECISGVDIGQYVERINCDSMKFENHFKLLDLPMLHHGELGFEHADDETFVPVNDISMTHLYPEIMILISHDITNLLKTRYQKKYLLAIVMQSIVYFNAVDMLISKLSTENIKIRMNLAGILIEEQEHVFNFLEPYHPDPRYMDVTNAIHHFLRYASRDSRIFTKDSFDFFLIVTSNMLYWSEKNKEVAGLSWNAGVYEGRCNHLSAPYWSGSVVHYTNGYEYITAAHEVAHLLHIHHDPLNKGYCDCHTQCYAIMQEENDYCPECLKWSEESFNDLKKFSR